LVEYFKLKDVVAIQGNDFVDLYTLHGTHITSFTGHNGNQITYFQNYNNYIFTGSVDRLVKVWDIKGNEIATLNGHMGTINGIIVYDRWVYSAGNDGFIKQFDLP